MTLIFAANVKSRNMLVFAMGNEQNKTPGPCDGVWRYIERLVEES